MRLRAHVIRVVLAAVACVAMMVAGGCSTGTASVPVHPVSPPPVSVPVTALVLPIEAYIYTPAQLESLTRAAAILERSCAARFGFTLPAPATVPAYVGGLVPRRYGQTDLNNARRYGYHSSSQPATGDRPIVLGALPRAEQLVLAGPPAGSRADSDTDVNHLAVPAGGCIGQAEAHIGGSVADFGRSPVADTIKTESYDHSRTTLPVMAVLKTWSVCMAHSGYHYADPLQATSDARWNTPTATSPEIHAAMADVACKHSTNLVGIWFAAEATYMNQQIDAESGELAKEKARKDSALAIAATINKGNS